MIISYIISDAISKIIDIDDNQNPKSTNDILYFNSFIILYYLYFNNLQK